MTKAEKLLKERFGCVFDILDYFPHHMTEFAEDYHKTEVMNTDFRVLLAQIEWMSLDEANEFIKEQLIKQ